MTTAETRPPRPSWLRENRLALWLAGLATLIISLFLLPDVIYFVQPGQAAVMWSRFFGGTVLQTWGEGAHLMFPWDKIYIYDIRLQQTTQELQVLSSDGLEMQIQVTTRFRLLPDSLPALHQNIGPEYVEKLIVPEVGAHFRSVMARYEPEQLYTTAREAIVDEILAQMRQENKVAPYPGAVFQDLIYVEDVLIRDVDLPQTVKEAIENKLAQRHLMLEYDYRLQREEKEKQRKKIEAEGIRMFQDIVSEGISDRYLKWKGIDATLELAKSPNSKIVVIGGKDGLPLILGPLESAPSTTPPPAPATPARPPGQ